jgi:hypothetical protein
MILTRMVRMIIDFIEREGTFISNILQIHGFNHSNGDTLRHNLPICNFLYLLLNSVDLIF